MESARKNGSYARPTTSQYYDYNQPAASYANPTTNKKSFSARAGPEFNDALDYRTDPRHDSSQSYNAPVQANNAVQRSDSRRMREPQAALHVPKPKAPLTDDDGDTLVAYDKYGNPYDISGLQPLSAGNASKAQPSGRPQKPTVKIPTSQQSQDEPSPYSAISPRTRRDVDDLRRGSVPDRSPLQKLEVKLDDISKEEKRARMEEAEHQARQRAVGDRTGKHEDAAPISTSQRRRSSANEPSRTTNDANPISNGRRNVSAPLASGLNTHHPGRGSTEIRAKPYVPDGRTYYPEGPPEDKNISANQRFHRASEALRLQSGKPDRHYGNQGAEPSSPQVVGGAEAGLDRSDSKKYRHRLRDAGYASAAIEAGMTLDGAGKSKDERTDHHDRRRSVDQPASTDSGMGRRDSKRLQKHTTPQDYNTGNADPDRAGAGQVQLHSDRIGVRQGLKAAVRHQEPDPLPPEAVKNPRGEVPKYQVPPQTAGGQAAREQVAFSEVRPVHHGAHHEQDHRHHRLSGMFHRHHDQERRYERAPELDELRKAGTAKLAADDLMLDEMSANASDSDRAWWERNKQSSGPNTRHASGGYDGAYEEEATSFKPPLFLKCGPLLRYTGMRRERPSKPGQSSVTDREIWRGSVMIVTLDHRSSYENVPVLRLFAQPMDLLPPPPTHFAHDADNLPSEYLDPIAGQVKVSRVGSALYVKPLEQVDGGVDLSREESEHGLFETTKSPTLGPQHVSGPDGQKRQHITIRDRSRIRGRDGEKAGKYREVKAAKLHSERGVTFWRFNLEIELGAAQARIAYRINRGPAIGFWVSGRGQSMNMMFHSCNGFSLSVDSNVFSGPDPLWRDVLNKHQSKPLHVMIGGGDQIYNDAATRDTILFKEWLQTKNPEHKYRQDFTPDMQDELETFYLDRYAMWFSQGLFSMANSQIPMVNIWDDHDIIDGYGSYPHHFMASNIFTGLGAVAYKYYMLFQHQSLSAETQREEPSWLLGSSPGPYINELSRSVFMFLGHKVAFLGLDCRTERMRDEILSQDSYDIIFKRCRAEIVKGETMHLIVLLGVPIAYPRLNFLENILTSRVMDPIKAIGRTGMLGGFFNKFDGGVEILDDLDDHWTAKHHKAERNWFIQELQELAAEKSVRVTILGGDVHLGAVGQFYTKKKAGVPKDRDHRYMPNIISSAIVNTPPPVLMSDVLNKRNKIHHLDAETDEDMIPMFEHDVDGKPRNNHHLLPRRNYCTIGEYIPGSTPPPTPPPEPQDQEGYARPDRRFPPGSMQRTGSAQRSSSLGRGGTFRPGNLIRRLSGSRSRGPPEALTPDQTRPYDSYEPSSRRGSMEQGTHNSGGSYFPPQNTRPTFHRRPTDLSEKEAAKAAAKGGAEGNLQGREHGHIDLEGGLDICLNMEVDQRDPAGITVPYRLLVPALWYEGPADTNEAHFKGRRASIMDRMRGKNERRGSYPGDSYSGSSVSSRSSSRSPSPRREKGGLLGRLRGSKQAHLQHQTSPRGQSLPPPPQQGPLPNRRAYGTDGAFERPAPHQQQQPQQPQWKSNDYGPAPTPPSARHPAEKNKELGTPALASNHPHRSGPANVEQHRAPVPQQPAPSPPAELTSNKKKPLFGFRRHTFGSHNRDRDEGYGRERYGEDSESSFTGSESESELDSLDRPPPRVRERRASKAERFFGIGDERVWGGRGGGGGGNAGGNRAATWGGDAPPGAGNGGTSAGGAAGGRQRMGSNGLPIEEGYGHDEGQRKKGWKFW